MICSSLICSFVVWVLYRI